MNLIEVKCPSCGGKLTVADSKSRLYKCQFCGNQFLLEEDKGTQNITNNYNIYQNEGKTSSEESGKKIALFIGVPIAVMLLIILNLASASPAKTTDVKKLSLEHKPVPTYAQVVAQEVTEVVPNSQLYKDITETIFGKPCEDVSESELSQVKYLKVSKNLDGVIVQYSLDDPYSLEAPVIKHCTFGDVQWDSRDIANFSGLVKIDMGYTLKSDTDLKQLKQLKGITCQNLEISELADMVADPAQITELEIENSDSSDGLISFVNLENLSLDSVGTLNLKGLTALKNLKKLSLTDMGILDYTSISILTGLEELKLEDESLKSIGFVKDMPALTGLSLDGTSVFSLEPLTGNTRITSLVLIGNDKMMDYQPIETLTGLKELTIDKGTDQPDPQLASLTQLSKLDISGFMSLSGIKNMQGLKELSIHGCNVDEVSVLSTLSGVEKLTFYSVWTYEIQLRSMDFVKGMTSLKYADFCGNLDGTGWPGYQNSVDIYGDISAVFNLNQMEELYLDNGQFEINFDQIGDSQSLRVLSLKNVGLHKNYYVESNAGMTNVWYDDVKLQDNMSFLNHFPNLEELYLDGNELTDLSFTAGNPKLSRLSMRDNYITDLSPLTRAEHLKYLDVTDNPLEAVGEIGDEVKVLY